MPDSLSSGKRGYLGLTRFDGQGQPQILKAQARLGHRDPVTPLRHYAHATLLDDKDVADHLDDLLNAAIEGRKVRPPTCSSPP